MASLILPRRFTQQPQGAVEVDWSNPITRLSINAANSPLMSSWQAMVIITLLIGTTIAGTSILQ